MWKKLMLSLISLGVLFVLAGPAFAHHGAAAYDMSKSVTVAGTITDFQFVNPHVLVFLDAKDDKGNLSRISPQRYAAFGLYPYPGTGPCATGG